MTAGATPDATATSAPPILPPVPKSKHGFRGPVRWLLSRELLAKLGKLAGEVLYSKELDHRDWMKVDVLDLRTAHHEPGEPFWFDYVADIGDGQLANYNLASLMLGRLSLLPESETTTVDGTPRRRLIALDDPVAARAGGAQKAAGAAADILPRGTFLLVGADTAYHVADLETLTLRTQTPFDWAYQRLHAKRQPAAEDLARPPWIFAIPGNHDLYDSLIGFNKFFARPFDEKADQRTRIADFNRLQTGSYFALDLPHDFRLVAMHSQGGDIDHRQATLLERWVREDAPRDDNPRDDKHRRRIRRKLIVATSQPSTVLGATNKDSREPFEAAELPRPFSQPPGVLPEGAIHLDLSGDVHHYARYLTPGVENYQSVVAGGGAFSHPTCTLRERDKLPGWPPAPVTLYPHEDVSRKETLGRLLQPNRLIAAGLAWIVGGLIAAAGHYGLTSAPCAGQRSGLAECLLGTWPRADAWRSILFDACLILAGLLWWCAYHQKAKLKPKQRERATSARDHLTIWICTGGGAGIAVFGGLLFVSRDHTGGCIGFALVELIATVGLALGAGIGGALGQSLARRILLAIIAVSLGLGVLLLPALLVAYASFERLVLAVASTWALAWLASGLFGWKSFSNRAALVAVSATLYVALWLIPCSIVAGKLALWLPVTEIADRPFSWLSVVAVGGLLTAAWFPGYLALAFALNCHNNEAGITAGVDRFCHFIRFKLEPERITGYVIGVVKLAGPDEELQPILVETFTLTSREAAPPGVAS